MLGVLGQVAYLSTGLLSPLLLASNSASIWTMCYITIQRHRAIHNPLGNTGHPARPFLPLICIIIMALVFNGSKWFEYSWFFIRKDDIVDPQLRESALSLFLAHRPSTLAKYMAYRQMMDKLLYPILVYIIPLLLLTILNFRILTTIARRPVPSDHKSRMAQERRAVTLIISIVLFFFICHTGGLVFRWMDLRQYELSGDWSIFVKDLINILFNFNSACNPLLYFLFTRQFRDLRMSSLRRPFYAVSSTTQPERSLATTGLHSHVEPSLLLKCRRVLLRGYHPALKGEVSAQLDSWPQPPQEAARDLSRIASRGTIRRNTCG